MVLPKPVWKKFGSDGSWEIMDKVKRSEKVSKKKLKISFGR